MSDAAKIARIANYLAGADGTVLSSGRSASASYPLGAGTGSEELAGYSTVTNGHPIWSSGNGWASTVVEERPFPYEGGAVRGRPHLQSVAGRSVESDRAEPSVGMEMGMAPTLAVAGACLIWFWENKLELTIWAAAIAIMIAPGADTVLK